MSCWYDKMVEKKKKKKKKKINFFEKTSQKLSFYAEEMAEDILAWINFD